MKIFIWKTGKESPYIKEKASYVIENALIIPRIGERIVFEEFDEDGPEGVVDDVIYHYDEDCKPSFVTIYATFDN